MDDDDVLPRVGGKPSFVAAHGIVKVTELTFEEAYGLARLVLELHGGPVAVSGKKSALLPRRVVRRLTELGYVEQLGESQIVEWLEVQVQRNFNPDRDLNYSALVRRRGATERAQWFAVATESGDVLARTCARIDEPGERGTGGRARP